MSECLTGVSVTRGDDRDDALTQLITAPLTFVTASSKLCAGSSPIRGDF